MRFSESIIKQRMTVYQVGYSGSQFTAGFLIKVLRSFLISDVHPLYLAVTVRLSVVTHKFAPFSYLVHLCCASLRVLLPLTLSYHNCVVHVYSCVISKYGDRARSESYRQCRYAVGTVPVPTQH
jgi:hypothetical protein